MYRIAATERLPWTAVPPAVVAALGRRLGSRPVAGHAVASGFSNGFAGPVDLADGRRFFVKVVSEAINPVAWRDYRREAQVVRELPDDLAVPALCDTVETELDGHHWFAAAYRWLDGRSPDPGRPGDLDLVIALTGELAATAGPPNLELPRLVDATATFGRWECATGPFDGYPSWLFQHRDRLVSTASRWPQVAAGTALHHGDLRLDNMVIADGRAWAVDWPAAGIGADFVDALLIGPALALLPGAPDLAGWIDRHPMLRTAPVDALETVAAAALGYFVTSSVLPPPPGLPTVRQFQRAQADVLIAWLARRWE